MYFIFDHTISAFYSHQVFRLVQYSIITVLPLEMLCFYYSIFANLSKPEISKKLFIH